jgi:hypothetical protein
MFSRGSCQTDCIVVRISLCVDGRDETGERLRGEAEKDGQVRASTLVIAAAIIAAVRLARDENISRPSPRLSTIVADSIVLAKMTLEKVVRWM